ncbi:hypothetical protein, partial [Petrachloros mirabilis]
GLILPSPFEQAYMNQSLQHLLTPPQLSTLAENARAFTRSKSLHQRSLYVTTIIEARAERNRQRVSSI